MWTCRSRNKTRVAFLLTFCSAQVLSLLYHYDRSRPVPSPGTMGAHAEAAAALAHGAHGAHGAQHVATDDRAAHGAALSSLLSDAQQRLRDDRRNQHDILVVVSQAPFFVRRDLPAIERAAAAAGFEVRRNARGVGGDRGVAGYLCFERQGVAPTMGSACHENVPTSRDIASPWPKASRIPGIAHVLGNKQSFCAFLEKLEASGFTRLKFAFACWQLPRDFERLRKAVAKGSVLDARDMARWQREVQASRAKGDRRAPPRRPTPRRWIAKPAGGSSGRGIFLISSSKQLKKVQRVLQAKGAAPTLIVTNYLRSPLLISGHKFDMRTYVLVTSMLPLRAYFFHDGLLRFASEAYEHSGNVEDRPMQFLTNTAIQGTGTGLALDTLTWSFGEFRAYLREQGTQLGNGDLASVVFTKIHDCIVRTLIASQPAYVTMNRRRAQEVGSSYHLLGIDVILDSKLRPRVIEINSNPSLALSNKVGSHYDATKLSMLEDVLRVTYAQTTDSDIEELKTDFSALGVGLADRRCASTFCIDAAAVAHIVAALREDRAAALTGFEQIYPAVGGKYETLVHHVERLIPGVIGGKNGGKASTMHALATKLKRRWHERRRNSA